MERAFRKCESCGYLYTFIRRVFQPNSSLTGKCPKCGGRVKLLYEDGIEPGTLVPEHRN